MKPRVGIGYDIHRLSEGRPLYLGGILIPHDRGLLGHSDGDSLIHAVIDALSGAAGFPDIGVRFPPGDEAFKDIRSTLLLEEVSGDLREGKWAIANIDAVVIAEKPRITPYVPDMKQALASILGMPDSAISIKATTNEGLGAIGQGEAIAAWAVALVHDMR